MAEGMISLSMMGLTILPGFLLFLCVKKIGKEKNGMGRGGQDHKN